MSNETKNELIEKPEWMMALPQEEWGVEELQHYIIPPRLKVVQALSNEDLTSVFATGDCVITPNKQLVCHKEETFHFTPLFFFAEWVTWNPLAMKGTLPAVRDRSLDPKSEVAIKARDPNKREEPCPENQQEFLRHQEHLNYIIAIHDNPDFENMAIVMSYSRASHRNGTTLNALIKSRRAPIFGCRFAGTVVNRKNVKGNWWEVEPANPQENPLVTQEQFMAYKELHVSYKEAHQKSQIQVDYGADTEDGAKDTEF